VAEGAGGGVPVLSMEPARKLLRRQLSDALPAEVLRGTPTGSLLRYGVFARC
jgi:hypothetical protein